MKSYSEDLRERVIALRSKGHTGEEVATLLSLSKRTVERYWRRYREICHNLSAHKVAGVKEAILSCGAELLYLSAYSPDLNPIEMVFSKLKAILRQHAERSFEALLKATSLALDRFSSNDCTNFFNHANYASL